ncbi:hypothetical protein F4811DRAFT_499863 [Daldinia bambusicola]|nr:hypothetical protein F4811DRAFT_499863 [Daldinia bambusicola]
MTSAPFEPFVLLTLLRMEASNTYYFPRSPCCFSSFSLKETLPYIIADLETSMCYIVRISSIEENLDLIMRTNQGANMYQITTENILSRPDWGTV